MTDVNYNLVVQQESRNVVVQTPGPKGLQGNAGTGMSSITVGGDTGSTGAIAGNASITIAGDGNRIATSASGSTITITDSGLRELTFTGDSGTTGAMVGASTMQFLGGGGISTSAGPGTKITVNHETPVSDPTGTYAYITSFTLDRRGHVSAVNKVDTGAAFRTNIGANNAANLDAGNIPSARVAAAAVTQHQSAINISGSQVTSGTVPAARLDNIATSKVTSGTFADARIAASNVTQHASSISIGNLGNVSSSSPADGAIFKYVNSSSEWQPSAFSIDLDATPQLGGNLDVNGHDIVSVSNANIDITPNGSGKVVLDSKVEVTDGLIEVKNSGAQSQVRFYEESSNNYVGLKAPLNANIGGNVTFVLPPADGTSNQVIQTDGSGNLRFATMTGDKAFKLDPTNVGIMRLFDDFLGGSGDDPRFRFLSTSNVTGGSFNNAFHTDTLGATGTDLFGLAEAETTTNGAARLVMNCNRLMSNTPSDGDEWLWEVRVKPQLATGNGYFMMAAIQPNGVGSIDHNDQLGVTAADDVPRALIYADKDNTYWKSLTSNSTVSVAPTAADTAQAYTDNTFVRLAVHCKYDLANTEYDITFYVDGTSRFSTSLDAGQGSPYGRIELCNNGTGTAQRALFDWTMAQYTRDPVTYLDIVSI